MTSPAGISRQTMRIIDANLDRIGEGLRVLEDIARFVLNDTKLTQQLKDIRHNLLTTDWPFQQQLLQSRDSGGDIGINIEAPTETRQRELPTVLVANARRVQEALRVIEELAKYANLEANNFKRARFSLYDIEQTLVSRLLRQDKTRYLSGLYVIIDTSALKGRSHIEAARQAIQGGATVIQLRDKLTSKKELLPIAQQLRAVCAEHKALFIVNDDLDLALAADADGLHLGQDDLPIKVARKLLAIDKILGASTDTVDTAVTAVADGADYIAVGSIYPTPSKEDIAVVGLKRLREIRQAVSLSVVAIGGITRDNAPEVMAAGADLVAVISAVVGAEDIEAAAREIMSKIEVHE